MKKYIYVVGYFFKIVCDENWNFNFRNFQLFPKLYSNLFRRFCLFFDDSI